MSLSMLKSVRAEFTSSSGQRLPISLQGNYTGPDAVTAASSWAQERGVTLAVHTMILESAGVRMRCSFTKDGVTVPGDLLIEPAYTTKPAPPPVIQRPPMGGYLFPHGPLKLPPERE